MKKKTYLKQTLQFFRPFWPSIAVIVGFMVVDMMLSLLSPYLFGKSADAVLDSDIKHALMFVGLGALVYIAQTQVLLYFRENIEIRKLDTNINRHLSNISLSKMLTFSIGQHNNENSGVKQHIVNQGQNSLPEMVFQMLYEVAPLVIRVLITTIVLCIVDFSLGIFVLLAIASYLRVTFMVNKKFEPTLMKLRERRQGVAKFSSEIYRNFPLVVIEGQEEKAKKDFSNAVESVDQFEQKLWLNWNKTLLTNRFFISIGQWGGLAIGVYLIAQGNMKTGMFVTLSSWLSSLFGSLYQVGRLQRRYIILLSQIKKYFDMMEIEPEIVNTENAIKVEYMNGKIEFKDVSFAYPKRETVLSEQDAEEADEKGEITVQDISFTIEAGQTVGIVGESGSGKSTIVNLFRRYHDPTEGQILVDNIDLKQIDLHSLRKQVGNVEQEVSLFDTTIKENILFGLNGEANNFTREDLDKVAKMASIDKFIAELKDDYNTVIGEKGIKLSGGERQRVAIARALAKNPKILIFDEATSALDSNNEKIVHEAIKASSKGRTTIIIAHRLSTVKDADKILVMSKGRLVAEGTHEELVSTNTEYQKLVKNQIF